MYFMPVRILSLILTSFHPHYDPTLVPFCLTLVWHLRPNSDHLQQHPFWPSETNQGHRRLGRAQHISWSQVPPTSLPTDLATPSSAPEITYLTGLPFPSPFQQSPTLPCTLSTPTPCLTPPLKAAPIPPPPSKVTQWPLWTPHPPAQTLLWCSLETLWVIVEIGWLPQPPILRVMLLK